MKVRAAGLLDLSRIEELHRVAQSHPNEVPAARMWSLLSSTLSALLPLAQETMLYVAEEGGKVQGFVQASGPPGALDLKRAKAIVAATTYFDKPDVLAEVSTGLGEAMRGLEIPALPKEELLAARGW